MSSEILEIIAYKLLLADLKPYVQRDKVTHIGRMQELLLVSRSPPH